MYSGDIGNNNVDQDREEEEQITLMAYESRLNDKINILFGETIGAILDLGCSNTVCGAAWLESYLETLDDKLRISIVYDKSSSVFKFCDGKCMTSLKCAIIPCVLAGKNIHIRTDVVDCNLPLLLSKASMKKAGMIIDTNTDTAMVFGCKVKLGTTSIGHYMLSIVHPPYDEKIEEILMNIDSKYPDAITTELHIQFAHPSAERLKKFLKDAGHDDKALLDSIEKVTAACETYVIYKRPHPRPIVTLPLATTFNETVYFLVMVDLATWLCSAWLLLTNQQKLW